jgi:peptide/nickel transport system permease protein
MTFVFLWTDILMWLLLFAIVFGVRSILKSPQNRVMWRAIFHSKVAMVAATILATYFTIAMIDSIHLKIDIGKSSSVIDVPEPMQGKVISLLDVMLQHLIVQQERTYSAPFSIQEYSTSIVRQSDGSVAQTYLALKYAGQHLEAEQSIFSDVLNKTLFVSVFSFFSVAILWSIHKLWVRRRPNSSFEHQKVIAWNAFYISLFFIVLIFSWLYYLSHFYHVLGTDKVGQDVLYNSVKSVRTGVMIGLLTTLVMLPLALILGVSAGYFKGWVDDVIQYTYTTLNSIPGVLLIAAAVLVMQSILNSHNDWFSSTEERADLRLLFLILILGVTSWTGLCRLLRAETLKLSQIEYVTAARAFGVSHVKVLWRHITPNLMHLVLIALVLDFSGLVLAEAVLSYVGVGVDPTMPSWGNMINQARLEMAREPMVWWSLVSAFCFMFMLVLSANLFADRVQRVLNPRSEK